MQAAAMDEDFKIRQWNQPSVGDINAPVQQMNYLTMQMSTVNPTCRAELKRAETEGLNEIDVYATNAKHEKEVKHEIGKFILDMAG